MKYVPQLHHELATAHLLANNRAALWMGMGLGKSGATLSAVVELFLTGKTRGVLVVAPLRVCVLTWPKEIMKWDDFRGLSFVHVMTKRGWDAMERGDAHIYLINWDNLAFLAEHFLHGKRATELPFDTVVFDESTRAKSHDSKRVNTFRVYVNRFPRRWELTGTPSPNGLLDLFAQIRLLDDGVRFGPSFNAFREAYFQPENPWNEYTWILKQGAAERIYKKVSDIALVLKSSDYLDVADTITHDVEVPLPAKAKSFYKELAENLLAITKEGQQIDAINMGVLANKLLQVTGGEVYLEQEFDDEGKKLPRKTIQIHDAKIKTLKALATRLGPEPLLIACVYQHEQTRIAAAIPGAVRFDSATSPKSQIALEDRWNKGQISVLLCHPASIGHGLNLQDGGRIVIWYSHTYNREHCDQLNARLARTGQSNVPEIYRLICPGSMDDAVIEALKEKGDNQATLLEAVKNFRALYLLGK